MRAGRTIDGLVVTIDGNRLPEHYEVERFTKYGFEWTYDGDSPRQLALAILFDYLGDKQSAIALRSVYEGRDRQSRHDWKLPAMTSAPIYAGTARQRFAIKGRRQ